MSDGAAESELALDTGALVDEDGGDDGGGDDKEGGDEVAVTGDCDSAVGCMSVVGGLLGEDCAVDGYRSVGVPAGAWKIDVSNGGMAGNDTTIGGITGAGAAGAAVTVTGAAGAGAGIAATGGKAGAGADAGTG